jgi:hypothetical protein
VELWASDIENTIHLVLLLGSALMELAALFDAVLRPSEAYTATGKLTKPAWILILVLALVTCIAFQSPISLFGIIGIAAEGGTHPPAHVAGGSAVFVLELLRSGHRYVLRSGRRNDHSAGPSTGRPAKW